MKGVLVLVLLLLPINVQAAQYFSFDNNSDLNTEITNETDKNDKQTENDSEFESPISNTEMVTVYYPVSKQTVTKEKKTLVSTVNTVVKNKQASVIFVLVALLVLAVVIKLKRKSKES